MESYLTIEEIMGRKYFKDSQIIGGEHVYKRIVKWVHVVEIPQFNHLLKGAELILTTGIVWKDDESHFLSFIKQLIQANAAGLCIEMGTHITSIPQKGIEFAKENDFPLILFQKEVPFVEITQDIHSVIINKQYAVLASIEKYSQELNTKLLEVNHYEQILKFIQRFLNVQVLTLFHHNEVKAYPSMKKEEIENLIHKVESMNRPSFLTQTIQILGENYADLVIHSNDRDLTDFDSIILDRTATSLAQYFLRDFYVEEKKSTKDDEWIKTWLDGEHTDKEINSQLSYSYPDLKLNGATVCICKFPPTLTKTRAIDPTYFILLFRNIMEQSGFQVISTERQHNQIFILGDKRSPDTWKERISSAFDRLNTSERNGKKRFNGVSYGVGRYVTHVEDVHVSYQTAKEVLVLREGLEDDEYQSCFYQDYHIHRILNLVHDHNQLEEILYEYLQPLIEHDQKFNGELLTTLRTYLHSNGSKQETAKKLFIVRQTLYHRLDKIERILGKDFLNPEKRLAIEFLVMAYDYSLHKKKNSPIRQQL
ncbi:PucR family transcriptional regulator [Mesobacillus maritimus]|uniref:PucR family transcriptional regulator n=1 Tax=Mesobacillus maritimus TaxID=1643336 RepID=UPI00384B24EE